MANPTTRSRSVSRRPLTAAARAAAKRAERGTGCAGVTAEHTEDALSGPTVLTEAPEDGRQDPPEPPTEPAPDADANPDPDVDADADPDPDVDADPDDVPESTAVRRLPRPLLAVLGVLLVAGLVAVGVLGWQYRQGQRAQEARGEALAAARKAAPVVLSYDYRHLDRDFARARGLLTGKFHDQYRKTTTRVVAPTAEKYHAVVKATVATASVVSASPDRAMVLLFVNQVTESTQVSGSRLDLNRVRMTMTRTDEGWRVSAVDAL